MIVDPLAKSLAFKVFKAFNEHLIKMATVNSFDIF